MKLAMLLAIGCVPLLAACGLSARFLQPAGRWLVEPDQLGYEFESFELQTGPHTTVHGWFLPSTESDGRTVVLCHGSGANISFYHPYYAFLHEAGYHVVLYDYRGYGKSEGEVSIAALFSDTERVLEYVQELPEVDEDKLVLFGTSLGSIVALRSAARHPELAGVIIEDAVSPAAALSRVLGSPLAWLVRTLALPSRLEPANNAEQLQCPSLFLCGAWDPALTQHLEVVEHAAGAVASWVQPETGHAPNGLLEHDGEYQAAVQRFLAACIEGRNPRVEVHLTRWKNAVVELSLADLEGQEDLPVELCLIDRDGNCEFETHYLGDEPLELYVPFQFVRAAAWPYQRVIEDRASETWKRERGPLALTGDLMPTLRALGSFVRDSSRPLEDARLFLAELETFEQEHGPLAPLAQTELIPEFRVAGEALLASSAEQDRASGVQLLERCVRAEPDPPEAHYWPASSYRVGFTHAAEVARARELLEAESTTSN